MEPKKVTINYALLCKQLEKRGKTKKGILPRNGEKRKFCELHSQ